MSIQEFQRYFRPEVETYEERNISLGIESFNYEDIFEPNKLKDLHFAFRNYLKEKNPQIEKELALYLEEGTGNLDESDVLINASTYLSQFIGDLFGIQRELHELNNSYLDKKETFRFKSLVVKRDMQKLERLGSQLSNSLEQLEKRYTIYKNNIAFPRSPFKHKEDELAFVVLSIYDRLEPYKKLKNDNDAVGPGLKNWVKEFHLSLKNDLPQMILTLNDDLEEEKKFLTQVFEDLVYYTYGLYLEQTGWPKEKRWPIFVLSHKLDFDHLIETSPTANGELYGNEKWIRRRDGFSLTDERMGREQVLSEVDYCLYCHDKKKDSCSKGFYKKDNVTRKKTPLGIDINGCPLDEKISEAHTCASKGLPLAGLAIIMIDNPMCPGTGHRICNDCMRGCIYQKQEPVNIPQIETRLLTDIVYQLPYGFEIFGLLTRWNPLNRKRPYKLPYNGKNILVVGQGPAGYTLAHYLSNEGFGVIGIDGLKIEPLPDWLTGKDIGLPVPIKNYQELQVPTDNRILMGFGGVSEYGITVRWDKNFLNLIYLSLSRKHLYRVYGGVRFGGTLKIQEAWELGFDHIAMATGAGKPTIIPMKNNMINGIRKASDFLMSLQLTGAAKKDSLASLQIRLPAVVIGGGLTGVDTATEIFAYYPILVEKVLDRYEVLKAEGRLQSFESHLTQNDRDIMSEYLRHGKEIRQERERARINGEKPNFIPMIRKWGGVALIYRKSLIDSPAYKLNHEEVEKALEEGIEFIEGYSPIEAVPDEGNSITALILEKQVVDEQGKWKPSGEIKKVAARSLCVAAGTSPNTIYEKEVPGTFKKDEWDYYFATHSAQIVDDTIQLEEGKGFFSSYLQNGKTISIYGDNHPDYAGNVVKAMASAKNGYPHVAKLFEKEIASLSEETQADRNQDWLDFTAKFDENFNAEVVEVKRLTPSIVEVIIKAPLAAKNFQPGQFYRMQRFETLAPIIENTRLATEGMALTGAWVDREKGLLSTIVLEMGHSSRLCANFKKGERIVCMGPTGEPTVIPQNETVLLIGGGLGNAVLFSIAAASKKAGNKVIYFAGYKNAADIFKLEELTKSTDVLVICTDKGELPSPSRPGDKIFSGNIVKAMVAYSAGELGEQKILLQDVNRLIVIGSDKMMAAVKGARCHQLKDVLRDDHVAFGSINSPMQCMMKEICAQCLQKHIDPKTGKEEYVFSCLNQDQHLDRVDFENLNTRLKSNNILEKLNNVWLDYCLTKNKSITMV